MYTAASRSVSSPDGFSEQTKWSDPGRMATPGTRRRLPVHRRLVLAHEVAAVEGQVTVVDFERQNGHGGGHEPEHGLPRIRAPELSDDENE